VLRLVRRLVGQSGVGSIVWCAACLFGGLVGCLCWLVGQSPGHRIIWMISQLVSCWMMGGFIGRGLGVWSMGRLAIGSLVRFIGGSCRSVGLSLGLWVGWLVDGSVGLQVVGGCVGCFFVACLVGCLLGRFTVLVKRSVSHLEDQSIGEFAGCLVGWFHQWFGGTLGQTFGASVGRSVSRLFVLLHSWLISRLVGGLVRWLVGRWVR
jgi:hypothetical protein